MRDARVMGNNIKLLLEEKGVSKEAFADALGYSFFDVQKLCDARLFASQDDINDISKYFGITVEQLFAEHPAEAYAGDGVLHCMNNFKSSENKEFILDIFDMYCDLKEALNINNWLTKLSDMKILGSFCHGETDMIIDEEVIRKIETLIAEIKRENDIKNEIIRDDVFSILHAWYRLAQPSGTHRGSDAMVRRCTGRMWKTMLRVVRKVPEKGKHSQKAIELVKKIMIRLENIPDGCAECFPFETIEELKNEYLQDWVKKSGLRIHFSLLTHFSSAKMKSGMIP